MDRKAQRALRRELRSISGRERSFEITGLWFYLLIGVPWLVGVGVIVSGLLRLL